MKNEVSNLIYTVREFQVMLDSDLAELFEVETKAFNQAVKRNINRFPGPFRFQLSKEEYDVLKVEIVSSFDDSGSLKNRTENVPVLRSQNVTIDTEVLKVTSTYYSWQDENNEYKNVPEFCSSTALEKIGKKDLLDGFKNLGYGID